MLLRFRLGFNRRHTRGDFKEAEITDDARDEYIRAVVGKMAELKKVHPKLCVAQALFKNKHRRMILDLFPDANFIWIQAEAEVIKARLIKRAGRRSAGRYYAEVINRNFEPPAIPHEILTNNGGREEVTDQIKHSMPIKIYADKTNFESAACRH